ncbi:MAG: DUF302 domain-containing protein [Pseudomonadota bacterium]
MRKTGVLAVLLLLAGMARAEQPGVLHWELERGLDIVYSHIYRSLEENKFFVIFEPNIGRNLAGFSERWGEDYNRSKLTGIRSMVFCNPWYVNQVSNLDPRMLALCPFHLSLYEKDNRTHIVFVRPGYAGEGSAAKPVLAEVEQAVSAAVEAGIKAATIPTIAK